MKKIMVVNALVFILLISLVSCNFTIIPSTDVIVDEDMDLFIIDLTKVYDCYVETSPHGGANLDVKFRVPEDTIYKYYLVSDEELGEAWMYEYNDNSYEDRIELEKDKNGNVYLLANKYYELTLYQGIMYGGRIEVKMWRP